MIKCLLMGSDEVFLRYYNLFRAYEKTGELQITGVSFTHMRATTEFYSEILGYRNILPEELDYDPEWYVIVMADGKLSRELIGMLAEAGIPDEKIIPYRILLIWDLVNSIAGDDPYLDIVELLQNCRVRKLSVNRIQ